MASRTSPGGEKEASTRACDACRKMKIRCTDRRNPPCKRCRTMGIACTFEMGAVPRLAGEEAETFMAMTRGRLGSLEGQVDGINRKLDDIAGLLSHFLSPRTASSTDASPVFQEMSSHSHTSDRAAPLSGASPSFTSAPSHALDLASVINSGALTSPFNVPTTMSPPLHLAFNPSLIGTPFPPSCNEDRHAASDDEEDDDDPLHAAMSSEPFRLMTAKEENVRLRDEGGPRVKLGAKRRRMTTEYGGISAKHHKNNTDAHLSDDDDSSRSPIRERGGLTLHCDPVTLGYCAEAEGRELFDAFFAAAHGFIPVLDPVTDTWESVRRRSPFLITAILGVTLRVRDGCRAPSELSKKCKQLGEDMGRATLFSPAGSLETLQALVIMSAWTEHAWRSTSHAMAMAVDMRLFRCLSHLHERCSKRARSRSSVPLATQLERERPLVAGARLWMALVKQTYEQSYNHALPLQFPCDKGERMAHMRALLDHPLTGIDDSRLIVSVELLEARECAFRPYGRITSEPSVVVDESLRRANEAIHERHDYWFDYYHRAGLGADHFLVKELGSQKAYAITYGNSPAWFGVHSKEEFAALSPERRGWLAGAARSAAFLVASIGSGLQERGSEFANHNFHVGIVAVARYLIRMAELLPDVLDMYQTAYIIDKLIFKLPDYPVHPLGRLLVRSVAKARQSGILPHTSLSEAAASAVLAIQQQSTAPAKPDVVPTFGLTFDSFPSPPLTETDMSAAAALEIDPDFFTGVLWDDEAVAEWLDAPVGEGNSVISGLLGASSAVQA